MSSQVYTYGTLQKVCSDLWTVCKGSPTFANRSRIHIYTLLGDISLTPHTNQLNDDLLRKQVIVH